MDMTMPKRRRISTAICPVDSGRRHRIRSLLSACLLVLLLASSIAARQDDFSAWLDALRAEALKLGIGQQTLDATLTELQPLPQVIELDRRQPEFTMTLTQYLERVIPETRVQRGKRLLNAHKALLARVAAVYNVQPRFIVALWGIESDYGRSMGGFPVIAALATLAYEGRRSTLFRRELLYALQIVDEGHIRPEAMIGSWAGAMGQNQFMPSSFRQYAVDYNRDGRRDIWTTLGDVFASTANYLARAGWRSDQTWGRRVTLPVTLDANLDGMQVRKPLPAWQALGVRRADGRDLPQRPLQASLLRLEGPEGPAFLVYENFRTLLKWNRSNYFALAVGELADRLSGK
jgi:membrane-bound lytic murein transglycosylase B